MKHPPYTPILATLGYIFSQDHRAVLMIHRTARGPTDPHFGKYNGLGGKLERGEQIADGMRREIREEAGIDVTRMSLAGTISWPGFGKNGEDWFGFIFRIFDWTGNPKTENDEGSLEWVTLERVLDLPLWPGDRHFLPWVLDVNQTKAFHGVMPYSEGAPASWSYEWL